MKKNTLIKCIFFLSAILLLLLVIAGHVTQSQNQPSEPGDTNGSAQTPSSSTQPAQPTESTAPTDPLPTETQPTETQPIPTQTAPKPTETEPQPTETEPKPTETEPKPTETEPKPTDPVAEGKYTRAELEAMSTKKIGYGSGRTSGGVRAPYAVTEQKKYGQYGASFIGEDIHVIYLTFDCGYEYTAKDENGNSYRVTEKILDVLKEKNVKAVFFITLPYAQKNGDLVQRMIDEGHTVGNHSANHPVMPDISIDRMIEEVMTLHNYVKDHFGYEMTLFRPPTGAYSVQSLCTVQNLGYQSVLWSFAHVDYNTDAQPGLSESYDLITRSHHNGAIYLLHAISTTNASVLGDVIDFFQSEGYALELLG